MFKRRDDSVSGKAKGLLWPKKGFSRPFLYLKERIMRMSASNHALSIGLACGAAASMTPFIGFHFFLGALFAYILRGNLFASAIGTIMGNPWTFPLIWSADIFVGNWVIDKFGLRSWLIDLSGDANGENTAAFLYSISLGGLILCIASFPLFYGLSYISLKSWRTHRAKRLELKRKAKSDRIEPQI